MLVLAGEVGACLCERDGHVARVDEAHGVVDVGRLAVDLTLLTLAPTAA